MRKQYLRQWPHPLKGKNRTLLCSTGVKDKFDIIIVEMSFHGKPEPEIFLDAARENELQNR
jgi:beta-phosphoglucomutase-like phosphatase (HAD superfamily)